MSLVTLEEAVAAVLERVRPLPAERVALTQAAGRVLASPARATLDLPPFAASAMDGYAVRAADTPGMLPVSFRIAAGSPAPRPLAPGEAMAIATGGALPEGADAVVPIELVDEADGVVSFSEPAEPGANVRPPGGDVVGGSEIVPAGVRLGPSQVGALGAAGLDSVPCGARPRVAIVTTGSELRVPGSPLGPGEIYESNGVMLAAQLAAAGADVEAPVAVADEEDAHRRAIEHGLRLNVLVTSGGVSVGPHDLVRRIEGELGVEEVFWGVAVKPGKPVSFGTRGNTLVFGLPGNPVSSLVACMLFVLPAIEALQGATTTGPRFEWGRLGADARRDARRDVLLRSIARPTENGTELTPLSGQDSHMIARAAGANALALVRRGDGTAPAGTYVEYLRL
ncbi:MAG TPA: gephyrin-like molybdotransferase Glp [Gaiellaceae bacterium]|nr:gephyrin-like molybdotransferase Glp [Gaiellaceae bacterium]